MTQYQVKDPDGVVHRIKAMTHVLDSNGLTLYASSCRACPESVEHGFNRHSLIEGMQDERNRGSTLPRLASRRGEPFI